MVAMRIHQIWMQGEENVPPPYRAYAKKLRALHPDFEYTLWDDAALRQVCWSLGDTYGRAYDRARFMHQKVDFGRYCLVLKYGGITIDMDVEPLRSFHDVIKKVPPHTLGVSEFPLSKSMSSMLTMRRQDFWVNNATLIAHRADLPAAQRLVDRMARQLLGSWWFWMPKSMAVMYTTGPIAFNAIFKQIPSSQWTMLPHTYFEPCFGYDDACTPSKDAVINHQHSGTWYPAFFGTVMRWWYRWIRSYPSLVFLGVALVVASIVFAIMYR